MRISKINDVLRELLEKVEPVTKTGVRLRVISGGEQDQEPVQQKEIPKEPSGSSNLAAKPAEAEDHYFKIGETKKFNGYEIHRYADHLVMTDTSTAGKRGKMSEIVRFEFPAPMVITDKMRNYLGQMEVALIRARTFDKAKAILVNADSDLKRLGMTYGGTSVEKVKSKDIPAGKIEINGSHIYLQADSTGFSAQDKDDRNNEPTIIPPMKRKAQNVKAFLAFISKIKREDLERMTFQNLLNALRAAGIEYHYYCAMD